MQEFFKSLEAKKIKLPENVERLLLETKNVSFFNTTEELADAATNGKENLEFEVKYDVPGKGQYVEAIVKRVQNGIVANYTEAYMRRRDPETMVIADDKPTDKTRFKNKYGYEFSSLEAETFKWLKTQDLAVFFYLAGRAGIGSVGIAIVPANAGFFGMGLSMLQEMISMDELKEGSIIKSSIFVAPVFRHTHFNGKQVVVHNRTDEVHELYAYNLYPGPSAKKGIYGVLLTQGEREGWITAHCSAVESVSPYDRITTFMHEGASGGGKSELHQHILREADGRVLVGKNAITGKKHRINIAKSCKFRPVSDDMAFCHPSVQKNNAKLTIVDAENSWFVRVDSVTKYGDDPALENLTIHPPKPLLFLNIDAIANSTALIWNHIQDEPGVPCPNPRVIIPRQIVPNVVDKPVSVDVRSFGLRAPQCTSGDPTYGIAGMFHILPPALAWLWRLVAPRGHKNPSIVSDGSMKGEGVGSYWPFATGKRIDHANMLLKQIIDTPRTTFTLVPNQHIGVWQVGFKPQLLMREYMTRRGAAKLRTDQYQASRCTILGYELNYLTIEGSKIPSELLQVYRQPEVGIYGYDKGAEELKKFFKKELKKYLQPGLLETGKRIIEACLNDVSIEEYNKIIPMSYEYDYSFNGIESYE